MSHLNILHISKEIVNINKNIDSFYENINTIQTTNDTINNNMQDLNHIKANKLDTILSLEQIKTDLKNLDKKVSSIDIAVRKIIYRNINKLDEHSNYFIETIKNNTSIDINKIHILAYIFDCTTPQSFLLINSNDLTEFGFSSDEIAEINDICVNELQQQSEV